MHQNLPIRRGMRTPELLHTYQDMPACLITPNPATPEANNHCHGIYQQPLFSDSADSSKNACSVQHAALLLNQKLALSHNDLQHHNTANALATG